LPPTAVGHPPSVESTPIGAVDSTGWGGHQSAGSAMSESART
jgi:hypothetical protein